MSLSVLKGIHRRALGLSRFGQTMARDGFIAGGEDRPAVGLPGPDTVALFDDVLGDLASLGGFALQAVGLRAVSKDPVARLIGSDYTTEKEQIDFEDKADPQPEPEATTPATAPKGAKK